MRQVSLQPVKKRDDRSPEKELMTEGLEMGKGSAQKVEALAEVFQAAF